MPAPCQRDHAVIIASSGRSAILADTLASLARQSALPGQVVLSVPRPEDAPAPGPAGPLAVEVAITRKGSSTQRNDGLDRLRPDIALVTFLDDDVELEPGYLAAVRGFLDRHPEVAIADGTLLRDGRIDRAQAIRIVEEAPPPGAGFAYTRNAYGCNMTVRRAVADAVRFDERLKLYAWLEDADFTRRCLAHGRCAQVEAARLVHLFAKAGRVSGRQFGFAQITNAYYLKRKGQMSTAGLLRRHWMPAVLANAWGTLARDPEIDRLGRLRGNLVAFARLASGRCEPEYVEKL